jgi:hypothetical protein
MGERSCEPEVMMMPPPAPASTAGLLCIGRKNPLSRAWQMLLATSSTRILNPFLTNVSGVNWHAMMWRVISTSPTSASECGRLLCASRSDRPPV